MHNFDGNACLGLLPDVQAALADFDYSYANPSAIHQLGQRARALVEDSRSNLAKLLKVSPDQRIIFTSGATESNNIALFYPYYRARLKGTDLPRYLSSSIEHPAVLETLLRLNSLGCQSILQTPSKFRILNEDLFSHDLKNISFLRLMAANNETGAINDISQVFRKAKKLNSQILTHTDAVQAIVKQDFDLGSLSADFVSLSGHKMGALTGIGALVLNDNLAAGSHSFGGPQEMLSLIHI